MVINIDQDLRLQPMDRCTIIKVSLEMKANMKINSTNKKVWIRMGWEIKVEWNKKETMVNKINMVMMVMDLETKGTMQMRFFSVSFLLGGIWLWNEAFGFLFFVNCIQINIFV